MIASPGACDDRALSKYLACSLQAALIRTVCEFHKTPKSFHSVHGLLSPPDLQPFIIYLMIFLGSAIMAEEGFNLAGARAGVRTLRAIYEPIHDSYCSANHSVDGCQYQDRHTSPCINWNQTDWRLQEG